MLLYPTIALRRVTEITPELLRRRGVRAIILDADNTLSTHNNPTPDPDVLLWIGEMTRQGIGLIIASNNNDGRIRPFADKLGLDFVSNAMKPLPVGIGEAARKLGLTRREVAVAGDQIFTDVLGGNLFGCVTILVEPMLREDGRFFRLKRWLETGILRRYRRFLEKKKEEPS